MDKELAERIANICIQEMEIANKKWAIQKEAFAETGMKSWEDCKTEAIKFLMENNDGN